MTNGYVVLVCVLKQRRAGLRERAPQTSCVRSLSYLCKQVSGKTKTRRSELEGDKYQTKQHHVTAAKLVVVSENTRVKVEWSDSPAPP